MIIEAVFLKKYYDVMRLEIVSCPENYTMCHIGKIYLHLNSF